MKKMMRVFLGMLVALMTTTSFAQTDNAAVLTFKSLEYDYGTIKSGSDGNCEFEFTNTGKEALILTDVRSTCGCTVPAFTREPVMPGQKGTIKVSYDTKRIGDIDKSITVLSSAKNSSVVLHIKGKIIE